MCVRVASAKKEMSGNNSEGEPTESQSFLSSATNAVAKSVIEHQIKSTIGGGSSGGSGVGGGGGDLEMGGSGGSHDTTGRAQGDELASKHPYVMCGFSCVAVCSGAARRSAHRSVVMWCVCGVDMIERRRFSICFLKARRYFCICFAAHFSIISSSVSDHHQPATARDLRACRSWPAAHLSSSLPPPLFVCNPVFVACVLCLAFDFWTVKNVTGR